MNTEGKAMNNHKCMVYQVCIGDNPLYRHCVKSVEAYCLKHGFSHFVQTKPLLQIRPDPFNTDRSRESYEKYAKHQWVESGNGEGFHFNTGHGFLPIFEKENAFASEYFDEWERIAVIDADVFIRPDAGDVFEEFGNQHAFGAVAEREMKLQPWYVKKIISYSIMQYGKLHSHAVDFAPGARGFEFFNMGVMTVNTRKFRKYLKGQTPRQFLSRPEFKDFVDGKGAWKWSTDQTLLNWFLKKEKISVKHLNPSFNGLFNAVENIEECDFVHFFLKDKLPNKGENVEELMGMI